MEDIPEIERITPFEAGKKLHMNAETVRAGLRQGTLPIRNSNLRQDGKMDIYNYKK